MCADAHASDALSAGRPVKKVVAARASKKGSPKTNERALKEDGKNETLLTGYSGSLTTH
jgi:hypothetical protein